MSAIFAVGDIHGQYRKLRRLLDALPIEPDDRLVFLGDYIDRGSESRQVLDCLLDLRDSRPSTVFLRGNHEQMMIDARDAWLSGNRRSAFDRYSLWAGNGGAETLDSYDKGSPWYERVPDEHWEFLESTTLELWQGPYAFVHAGLLPPGCSWPYDEDPRLWIREEFIESRHDFGAFVVYGHTPQRTGRPHEGFRKLCIDTAAAYGGPLSAVKLDAHSEAAYELYQS